MGEPIHLRPTGRADAADLAVGQELYYHLRVLGESVNQHEGGERLIHREHMANEGMAQHQCTTANEMREFETAVEE